MPVTIPTVEPDALVSADTWQWDRTLPDYLPSDGWQLSYQLRGPTDLDLDWGAEVTANGDVFEVRVPFASTDALTPGPYTLYGRVTDGTSKFTVVCKSVEVLADPTDAVDAEHPLKLRIDAMETAITALEGGVRTKSVNGRSVTYNDLPQLKSELNRLKLQYQFVRTPHAGLRHDARFVG